MNLLTSYISSSTALQKLNLCLSENRVDELAPLFWACTKAKNLQSFTSYGASLDLESVAAIVHMIEYSKVLYELELGHLQDEESFLQILGALELNQSLVRCKLHNSFPKLPISHLAESAMKFRTLKTIGIQRASDDEIDLAQEYIALTQNEGELNGRVLDCIELYFSRDHYLLDNIMYKDADVRGLIFDTRLFCGARPKECGPVKRCVPFELIEKILFLVHFDDKIFYEDQLKKIIRCLLDRRTLGKIVMDGMKPSKNFMYVRCRNIVESLKLQ